MAAAVAYLMMATAVVGCIFYPLGGLTSSSSAQDYTFSLAAQKVDVTAIRDGSVNIDYYFQFTNVGYLDGVDVGMPNSYYDLSSSLATIQVGGETRQPSQIRDSPYVTPGIAVEFDQTTIGMIQSFGSFELTFSVNNPHMIYNNTLVPGTAGVRFRPTWFST
jgi:hypothetical protein